MSFNFTSFVGEDLKIVIIDPNVPNRSHGKTDGRKREGALESRN